MANLQLSNLSAEQLTALQAFAKQNGLQLDAVKSKTKEIDRLNYADEEKVVAICLAHDEHQFKIDEITDEELKIKCKRTGLCPRCLAILDEAELIKKKMARTRQFVSNQPSEDKPGFKIREIIKTNADKIAKNKTMLKQLQDADFCKKTFKLQYALLLDITGKNAEELAASRKDAKGYVRFSPQQYQIGKKLYLLTNDLYAKNLAPIQDYFAQLNK